MEGGFHGHDGIRRWWRDLLGFLPDVAVDVLAVRDLGDLTVAALRIRGHGAESAAPVDETVWSAAEWRHGKCVWWANFGTEAAALEAVRLRDCA